MEIATKTKTKIKHLTKNTATNGRVIFMMLRQPNVSAIAAACCLLTLS